MKRMTSSTPTAASEASDSERDAIRREIQLEIERQVLAALAPSAITAAPTAPAGGAGGSAGIEARTRGTDAHASQAAVWNKHQYLLTLVNFECFIIVLYFECFILVDCIYLTGFLIEKWTSLLGMRQKTDTCATEVSSSATGDSSSLYTMAAGMRGDRLPNAMAILTRMERSTGRDRAIGGSIAALIRRFRATIWMNWRRTRWTS